MVIGARALRKAERPDEILQAALDEFVLHGYMAARLEDVATKIGVTKGTVYFYFESKERLFEEVIRRYSPSLIDQPKSEAAAESTVSERIKSYIRFIYAHVVTDRETRKVFHLLASEGRHFPALLDEYFTEFLEPALAHVRDLLGEGVKSGEFRASETEQFPEILLAPVITLNLWLVVFGDRRPTDQELYTEAHLDVLMSGLRKPKSE